MRILMRMIQSTLTVDVIGAAAKPWSSVLEQGRAPGITPFFVMEQTARTGP
jgi:hypothetical protein